MSKKTKSKISLSVAMIVWIACTLGAAVNAFAHPRQSDRIELLEKKLLDHVGRREEETNAFWAHTWPALVGRVDSAERGIVENAKLIIDINQTIFLATGAILAFQYIVSVRPKFLFKGEKRNE